MKIGLHTLKIVSTKTYSTRTLTSVGTKSVFVGRFQNGAVQSQMTINRYNLYVSIYNRLKGLSGLSVLGKITSMRTTTLFEPNMCQGRRSPGIHLQTLIQNIKSKPYSTLTLTRVGAKTVCVSIYKSGVC